MLHTIINFLLSAEAGAIAGAEYGHLGGERLTRRNGYRLRDLDTCVGTIDLAAPHNTGAAAFYE